MATGSNSPHFRRYPQPHSVELVRWVPPIIPSSPHRLLAAAAHDPSTSTSSLLFLSPNPNSNSLTCISSLPFTSRITSLRSSWGPHPLLAASTVSGDLNLITLSSGPHHPSIASSIPGGSDFHVGAAHLDVDVSGRQAVVAGEDGRVHVVDFALGPTCQRRRVGGGKEGYNCNYTAARWGSEMEFATGGVGATGVKWWDLREDRGVVAHTKGTW